MLSSPGARRSGTRSSASREEAKRLLEQAPQELVTAWELAALTCAEVEAARAKAKRAVDHAKGTDSSRSSTEEGLLRALA
jgi:hypothetical protein